jgi:threonine synthase
MSYITYLQCSHCADHFDPEKVQTFCTKCQTPLLACYDLGKARQELDRDEIYRRSRGMWRWRELLPVIDEHNMVTLGEGDAPLLPLPNLGSSLGLENLYVKDESLNPTGSFKARGISAAISKARELGIEKVIIPTAGNAGGAMAAYAARAGLKAHIFMPKDTPLANVEECKIAGAGLSLIDGLISDAASMAGVKAREEGWFDLSTFKEPYRTEGKKIMGYELAEAFHWELPEVIIYPTGGGTGLVGMWKAFAELAELGWLANGYRPRMIAVQAAGCAPVVKAFESGSKFCDFWLGAQTRASGLRVPKSFADQIILHDIRESHGLAIAVTDTEILDAQKNLGSKEGIFAAPEGAATVAALIKLIEQKQVNRQERIVCFNTGSGLKYLN